MNKKLATTAILLSGSSIAAMHVINRVHTSLCTSKSLLGMAFRKNQISKKRKRNPIAFYT